MIPSTKYRCKNTKITSNGQVASAAPAIRIKKASLLVLALLTGVGAMGGFALLLMGYRWLAARKPKLALLVYGLIMLVLLPAATVIGNQFGTRSGVVTFGGGYTVWHDVLVGEVFFLAPILLYEALRRRLEVSTRYQAR